VEVAADLQRFCADLDAAALPVDDPLAADTMPPDATREVLTVYQDHTQTELTRMLVEATENGAARDGPFIPTTPFLVYTEALKMAAFLRRVIAFHRPRLIAASERRPQRRWDCAPFGNDGDHGPNIQLRMNERRIIDWRHVYRTLWPTRPEPDAPTASADAAPYMDVFVASVRIGDRPHFSHSRRPPTAHRD
jgi:hypothetical protein